MSTRGSEATRTDTRNQSRFFVLKNQMDQWIKQEKGFPIVCPLKDLIFEFKAGIHF